MRIDVRDAERRRIGRIDVDPSARPTRVPLAEAKNAHQHSEKSHSESDVFLTWDRTLDDAGRLRRCLVCGCTDLFQEKVFPQVTAIVVVLAFVGAFAGAFTGIFGREINLPLMVALVIVLVLDICILVFARRRLVCYRCRSSYHGAPIARYHKRWDRATADRYPAPPTGKPSTAPEQEAAMRGEGSSGPIGPTLKGGATRG